MGSEFIGKRLEFFKNAQAEISFRKFIKHPGGRLHIQKASGAEVARASDKI